MDAVPAEDVAVQQLPDGTAVFVAENIPATGYKTYSLGRRAALRRGPDLRHSGKQFYRITVNPVTGALTSLFDKTLGVELVETNAPHAFNEYLYEFRSTPAG